MSKAGAAIAALLTASVVLPMSAANAKPKDGGVAPADYTQPGDGTGIHGTHLQVGTVLLDRLTETLVSATLIFAWSGFTAQAVAWAKAAHLLLCCALQLPWRNAGPTS